MQRSFISIGLCLITLLLTGCSPPASNAGAQQTPRPRELPTNATPREKIIAAALEQTTYTLSYDPAYVKLDYPGGDIPIDRGVCADVIVRAFRKAGVDLQKDVHEDMKRDFGAYPRIWGARAPDPNIDHRRVANLMKYFTRKSWSLALSNDTGGYVPGDVVAWDLGGGLLHIGLLTDEKSDSSGRYLVVHNIGSGAQLQDVLFSWKIIGHYRCFAVQ
ncbi:MAG TPA: DUF1287 domain-containing protein [Blastocatellia bacterium]|nr:DUF1287 domain-containing protein [Blastocatellia bacterium]